jgi:hypothetical protein
MDITIYCKTIRTNNEQYGGSASSVLNLQRKVEPLLGDH